MTINPHQVLVQSQRFCLNSILVEKDIAKIDASEMVISAKERLEKCLAPRLNNVSGFDPAYNAKSCILLYIF